MSWKEDLEEILETRLVIPNDYRLRPHVEGVLVYCGLCGRDIVGPVVLLAPLLDETLDHHAKQHQR